MDELPSTGAFGEEDEAVVDVPILPMSRVPAVGAKRRNRDLRRPAAMSCPVLILRFRSSSEEAAAAEADGSKEEEDEVC